MIQRHAAIRTAPVVRHQLLVRGQPQAGEACLLSFVQLGQRDGVYAAADDQQPRVQCRAGDICAAQPQQLRQHRAEPGAARQHTQPTVVQQGAACAAQFVHRGGIKNQNAILCRNAAVCRQRRETGGGQVSLLGQQVSDGGVAHRLERVNAERAFGDRHAVDVLHTVFCHAVHLGEGGQKCQLAAAAGA